MKKEFGNLTYHALINSLPLVAIYFLIKKCIDEAEAIPFFIYCSLIILFLVIARLRMIESYCLDGDTITINRIHNSESFLYSDITQINYTNNGSIEVHLNNSQKHFMSSTYSTKFPALIEQINLLTPDLPSPQEIHLRTIKLTKKEKIIIAGLTAGLILSLILSF